MAHRRSVIVIAVVALFIAFGLWRSARAASDGPLGAIQGTWHLTQVSDGHVTAVPAKATWLEFAGKGLQADDGTNHATAKLINATRKRFFFGDGNVGLVGYGPSTDARQALSRGPLQHLLFTPDAVNYTKISPHNLVLQSDGYTYTLTK